MTTSLANFIASLTAGALVLSAIGIALIIISKTTSLANFIASLTAGALVLSAIGIALIIISKNDRVQRS